MLAHRTPFCEKFHQVDTKTILINNYSNTTKNNILFIDVSVSRRKPSSGLTSGAGRQYVKACPIPAVIYQQRFGTAMGSPVSPIIANLFTEWLEQRAIATAPVNCRPRLWKRFVDDTSEVKR